MARNNEIYQHTISFFNEYDKNLYQQNEVNYTLKCKDEEIAKFSVANSQVTKCKVNKKKMRLLPMYMRIGNPDVGLQTWLLKRHIDFNRTNGRKLLKAFNLNMSTDINNVLANNSLSLTDCYWTQKEGKTQSFSQVSLYRKKESKYVVDLSLSGVLREVNHIDSNAELTNIGSFEKAWRYINGSWRLYKRGNKYNYYAELFYYYLAKHLNINIAEYYYDTNEKMIYSINITNEEVMLEHYDAFKNILDFDKECKDREKELVFKQYLDMSLLDAITCNYDRHEFNWGCLRDSSTGKLICIAPIFDNNLCLGADSEGNEAYIGIGMIREYINTIGIRDYQKRMLRMLSTDDILTIDRKVKENLQDLNLDTTKQINYLFEAIKYLSDFI